MNNKTYWVVDRRVDKIDSLISKDIDVDKFPYAIHKKHLPLTNIDYQKYFEDVCATARDTEFFRTVQGAHWLARTFGYGLRGCSPEQEKDIIQRSYGALLVRASALIPPISAKEWRREILKGREK